jgi:hypothetical protein
MLTFIRKPLGHSYLSVDHQRLTLEFYGHIFSRSKLVRFKLQKYFYIKKPSLEPFSP